MKIPETLRQELLIAITNALNSCGCGIRPEWILKFVLVVLEDYEIQER